MLEKEPDTEEKIIKTIRHVSLILGIALITIGAISLIYITSVIFNMLQAPYEIPLINWSSNIFSIDTLFINGHFDSNAFEVSMSPAIQYLFYAILALFIIRIITSLINSFISGGTKLIELAKKK